MQKYAASALEEQLFQESESNSGGTSRKHALKGVSGLSKGGLEWKFPYFLQCVEGKTVSMNVHWFLVCGIEDGRELAEILREQTPFAIQRMH